MAWYDTYGKDTRKKLITKGFAELRSVRDGSIDTQKERLNGQGEENRHERNLVHENPW